jgi:hypothetical protein
MRGPKRGSHMSPISSESIFHFTSSMHNLTNILKNEFQPMLSFERIVLEDITLEGYFPMVCFCNIPLSQINRHIDKYGHYGIGMSYDWVKKTGLNPVLYLRAGSILSTHIKKIYLHLLQQGHNRRTDEATAALLDILRYIKAYRGNFYMNGRLIKRNVKFYDERELRYVPNPARVDGLYYLSEDKYNDPIQRNKADSKLGKLKLRFEPNDISYIIIDNQHEITEMVNVLNDIKRPKYSTRTVEILTTKIITCRQILKDF